VKLYLHSSNMPSWCGAQLKHRVWLSGLDSSGSWSICFLRRILLCGVSYELRQDIRNKIEINS
jgi:hypothetical protein